MKGIVLAAGFGTRFRPVTNRLPKPILPLCNRPIISYAIDALIGAGVDEIAINLHHLPDLLESTVRAEYEDRCSLYFSKEEAILGTGGAIRRLRKWIGTAEEFILVNGDTVQQPPFQEMLATHRRRRPAATLLLRHPPPGDRFTPVIMNDGSVVGFGEKAIDGDRLMFAGAHVLSPEIFDELPDRDVSGITEDVYFRLAEAGGERLSAVVDDGMWFDVGSPRRYMVAHRGLLRLMGEGTIPPPRDTELTGSSVIDRSALVEGSVESSAVGPRARMHPESSVLGCAIWSDVTVGAGSRLQNSIICAGATIPERTKLEDVLVLAADAETGELPPGTRLENGLVIVPIV